MILSARMVKGGAYDWMFGPWEGLVCSRISPCIAQQVVGDSDSVCSIGVTIKGDVWSTEDIAMLVYCWHE